MSVDPLGRVNRVSLPRVAVEMVLLRWVPPGFISGELYPASEGSAPSTSSAYPRQDTGRVWTCRCQIPLNEVRKCAAVR